MRRLQKILTWMWVLFSIRQLSVWLPKKGRNENNLGKRKSWILWIFSFSFSKMKACSYVLFTFQLLVCLLGAFFIHPHLISISILPIFFFNFFQFTILLSLTLTPQNLTTPSSPSSSSSQTHHHHTTCHNHSRRPHPLRPHHPVTTIIPAERERERDLAWWWWRGRVVGFR